LLYFFLSYARGDDDLFVKRFFDDLSAEVRVLAGVDPGQDVGFLDSQSIEVGMQWKIRMAEALSESRCFIALCTPRYFLSKYCGSEWSAFEDRLRRYEASSRVSPNCLMPLEWCALDDVPEAAEHYQRSNNELGTEHATDGIRQLIRLNSNRDDYRRLLSALARKIVRLARTHALPPLPQNTMIESFPTAFPPAAPGDIEDGPHGPVRAGTFTLKGGGFVHFVVAAASREEMQDHRENIDYYGNAAEDWSPYRPERDEALAALAMDIAGRRSFQSQVAGLTELHSLIMRANRRNEVVVLLVDAWATRIDEPREMLMDYDRSNEPTTAVLIPISQTDQETTDSYPVLRAAVRAALPNNSVRRDEAIYHEKLENHSAFDFALSRALRVAQNRIFDRGRPPGDSSSGRPILPGPM
jgi:FxsC-like protein